MRRRNGAASVRPITTATSRLHQKKLAGPASRGPTVGPLPSSGVGLAWPHSPRIGPLPSSSICGTQSLKQRTAKKPIVSPRLALTQKIQSFNCTHCIRWPLFRPLRPQRRRTVWEQHRARSGFDTRPTPSSAPNLLVLMAADGDGGLDFDVALTSCCIVADTHWDNGYLAQKDGAGDDGLQQIDRPRDGLLHGREFFFLRQGTRAIVMYVSSLPSFPSPP